jgi:hypothetical protein
MIYYTAIAGGVVAPRDKIAGAREFTGSFALHGNVSTAVAG